MLVPYQPQGDYDLEFQVERLEGEGGLIVGLVIGEESTQLALGVNAFADQGGPYTGILPTDLKSVAPTPRLVKHEPRLAHRPAAASGRPGSQHGVAPLQPRGIDRWPIGLQLQRLA